MDVPLIFCLVIIGYDIFFYILLALNSPTVNCVSKEALRSVANEQESFSFSLLGYSLPSKKVYGPIYLASGYFWQFSMTNYEDYHSRVPMLKVSKSQKYFFLKLHCPQNEQNIT